MQSGSSGYFIGRDGIPTDTGFLAALIKSCGDAERSCREVYPLVFSDRAKYSIASISGTELGMYFGGVSGFLEAAAHLHRDDVVTLSQLQRDPSIERANALYTAYRASFLGKWLASAPFPDAEGGACKGLPSNVSPSQFREKCLNLANSINVFVTLCNKINAYGYEQAKLVMLSRGDDDATIMLVDRAMRFYKWILEKSDVYFKHAPIVPYLAVPPRAVY